MKVSEEWAARICRAILLKWKERGLVRFKKDEGTVLKKMVEVILADARREEQLDRDVAALLEKHAADLDRHQASAGLMFQKIKDRLAKERGIVL
jgi:hypothetical protein